MPSGRLPLDIDPVDVQKLAELGCRVNEIADFYKCSISLLQHKYLDDLNKGRANLKLSLRRKQIQLAMDGNVTLLIWLGKQLLDQVDRQQLDITKIDDETFMREAQRRLRDEPDPTPAIDVTSKPKE